MMRRWFLFSALLGGLSGCDPYGNRLPGEFNAGSADPFDFAPPYRGTGFTRQIAGRGTFTERRAFIGASGSTGGYYFFPFSPSQINTTNYAATTRLPDSYSTATSADFLNPASFISLRVRGANAVPTPMAYVFDTTGTPPNPLPSTASCIKDHDYDPFKDDVRYDEQGSIFSSMPTANWAGGSLPSWSYVPIVQEVPVTSNGEKCQDIKSQETLLKRTDVTVQKGDPSPDGTPTAVPDGKYLAWGVIDPGSPVFRVGETANNSNGLGCPSTINADGVRVPTGAPCRPGQKFGWFNRFLVAYIDGGYIPTTGPAATLRMRTQRLFYPRQIGTRTTGAGIGLGVSNDVIEFARSDTANYSPLCQVISYVSPTDPPPNNLTAVLALQASFAPPPVPPAGGTITPTFIFCLQVL
jgi:hypothetical protein